MTGVRTEPWIHPWNPMIYCMSRGQYLRSRILDSYCYIIHIFNIGLSTNCTLLHPSILFHFKLAGRQRTVPTGQCELLYRTVECSAAVLRKIQMSLCCVGGERTKSAGRDRTETGQTEEGKLQFPHIYMFVAALAIDIAALREDCSPSNLRSPTLIRRPWTRP